MKNYVLLFCLLLMNASLALSRETTQHPSDWMGGMHHEHAHPQPATFIDQIIHHATSGTSVGPNSTPHAMLMTSKAGWELMFHFEAFLNAVQQSGPRGDDKVFSTSWFMPMAQRRFGNNTVTVRTMLSLDPATVTHRVYPELFQQGETAFGRPIVDVQHPHDFMMEPALLYDYKLGDHAMLTFYAAT